MTWTLIAAGLLIVVLFVAWRLDRGVAPRHKRRRSGPHTWWDDPE